MKRNILTSLVFALITISLYAQDPNILWQRTIGGSDLEYLASINLTNDEGSIIGGASSSNISGEKNENSNGGIDIWILKIDSQGEIQWQNTIGGSGDDNLFLNGKIIQTTDGGYFLGCTSNSNISGDKTENSKGFNDFWVLKLSASGDIEWQKTIGGSGQDFLFSLLQTNDNGFVIGGSSTSNISGDKTEDSQGSNDYWVLKINETGMIEWQNTIGGSETEILQDIRQTSDGGFIVGGSSYSGISGDKTEASNGGADYWIVKINQIGIIEWQKTFGGSDEEILRNILQTDDEGYIISGESNSNISGDKTENSNGDYDYWIIKTNSTGNIEWQNTIGGSDSERFPRIIESQGIGYIVGGESYSNISGDKTENSKGLSDCWVLLINDAGNILNQKTIGGNDYDGVKSFYQNNEGNLIIGADSSSNISGDKTENSRGDSDYWIFNLDDVLNISDKPFATAIILYPNPTKNTLQLNTQDKTIDQINIYTMTGSRVLQMEFDTVSPTLDVSSLAAGVYYIQLYSGINVALKKFVKE